MKSSRKKRFYFLVIFFFIIFIAGALPGIVAAPDSGMDTRHLSVARGK